jgi:GT2 family glycosyltransferase
MKDRNKISVIVPVYKNIGLLKSCISSLLDNISELKDYEVSLFVINDSPDDEDVCSYLYYLSKTGINVITNQVNIGFIGSVNKAFKDISSIKCSVILVNSDTVTFPGTLKNLVAAAFSDPQIGFACPRSNNAAISTFPHFPHKQSGLNVSPAECYKAWASVSDKLPEITFAPTAVGFYLLIKDRVLNELNQLDESFGVGYEEENDFIMRANKLGFLSVLANKSFAYHAGSASFNLVLDSVDEHKAKNLEKLKLKHPEFIPLVQDYENSPAFYAERMIKNLIPSADDKFSIVFDLRRIWKANNGTSRLTKLILENICPSLADKYVFYAICNEDVFNFHQFSKIRNLNRVSRIGDDYTVSINLGQPFELDQINTLENLAPINVYGMLDTIAYDCGYLRVENDFNLDRYWSHVARHANGLFFISKFGHETYLNRFSLFSDLNSRRDDLVQLLPTNTNSYFSEKLVSKFARTNRHILVLGNHFKHKNSYDTAKCIADCFPSARVLCLGGSDSDVGNLSVIKSGDIDEDSIIKIFASSSLIVLPSFYEGFGIGLVEALGFGIPLVARNIPATQEILASYTEYNGVYLYDTTSEMLEAIPLAVGKTSYASGGITWGSWVSNFDKFISNLIINSDDIYKSLYFRFINSRSLIEHDKLKNMLRSPGLSNSIIKNETEQETVIAKNNGFTPANLLSIILDGGDDEFIDFTYRTILGRGVDAAGLSHYKLLLKKNEGDRVQIFRDILFSTEVKKKITGIQKYKFNKRILGI